MANFFYAVAVFADGHKETFEGRLWFLGGVKDEAGHALLRRLRADEKSGKISKLYVSYES